MDSIQEKILAMLQEKFSSSPSLDDGLIYVGADSVGMAELTVELEKEFDITVSEDIFQVETVKELIDYVRQLRASSD